MTGTPGASGTTDPADRSTPAFVLVTALAVVALQLATGWRYGLFRDELYYLACASHLDWGYVDHPPLSIVVLAGVRGLLGDGLLAVRLVPALLFGLLVWLAARLARELGGGRFAQSLAALAVAVAPEYLALTGFYSMNAFDLVFWAAAPLAVPVLPVETLIAYQRTLGIAPTPSEKNRLGPLHQHFADRFGWEELTREVARIYAALPAEERATVRIVTRNYGEAGAIDYYGRSYGLPAAVSPHNNYYLWGPGPHDAQMLIMVGWPSKELEGSFSQVEVAGRVESPYAMPFETRWPIHLCRGLKTPLDEAWRRGKTFI